MAQNIEIKARVRDPNLLKRLAESVSDSRIRVLQQEDVFFNAPRGRLKLRIIRPDAGELITYERPDAAGPKSCDYSIYRTSEPHQLRSVLEQAYGVRGIVCKTRRLYLSGQTRIHIDDVEGLGSFMELECVLRPGQTATDGQAIVRRLMNQLGVTARDLVDKAYIDLLEEQARAQHATTGHARRAAAGRPGHHD